MKGYISTRTNEEYESDKRNMITAQELGSFFKGLEGRLEQLEREYYGRAHGPNAGDRIDILEEDTKILIRTVNELMRTVGRIEGTDKYCESYPPGLAERVTRLEEDLRRDQTLEELEKRVATLEQRDSPSTSEAKTMRHDEMWQSRYGKKTDEE